MSAPGYNVDREQLYAHAAHVAELAARITNAADTANQVGFGGFQGFGLLCSIPVGGVLQYFQGGSDDLLRSAANLGEALSEAIAKTAAGYTTIEDDVVAVNRDLGKTL
jgi:hypothetical protein